MQRPQVAVARKCACRAQCGVVGKLLIDRRDDVVIGVDEIVDCLRRPGCVRRYAEEDRRSRGRARKIQRHSPQDAGHRIRSTADTEAVDGQGCVDGRGGLGEGQPRCIARDRQIVR